ncbi:MAG: hypothetical protein DHS20C15_24150 [Planctomycetota bacterium]|nr:MAG: hypothetical protein DHS20C15_24150 [Planctomycetota bacterium]
MMILPLLLLLACAPFANEARERVALTYEDGVATQRAHGAVRILLDGELLLAGGSGRATEQGTRVTSDTPVRIASVTKLFTQLAVLRLVQAGTLDLDLPVGHYRPSLPAVLRDRVTLRQLLAMQSGLPRELTDDSATSGIEFDDEGRAGPFLDALTDLQLESEPGSRTAYSNVGYWMVGAVLEAVGQDTWEAVVKREVLTPLGLEATRVDHGDGSAPDQAWGFVFDGDGVPQPVEPFHVSQRYCSGSLLSTARDLATLGSALLQPGFLEPRTHAELFSRFGAADAEDRESLSALGHVPGFANVLHVNAAHGLVLVVLNNAVGDDPMQSGSFATGALVRAALGDAAPPPRKEVWYYADKGLPDSAMGRAVGTWIELVRAGDRDALIARHEEFFLPGEFAQDGNSYAALADLFLSMRDHLGGGDFEVYCYRDEAPPEFYLWLRGEGRELRLMFRPAPSMPTHIKDIAYPAF